MSLNDFLVSLSVTTIISCMEKLDLVQIQRPIRKYADLLVLIQTGEVNPISSPDNWHGGTPAHVTFNFDIVPDGRGHVGGFERFVQRDYRHA